VTFNEALIDTLNAYLNAAASMRDHMKRAYVYHFMHNRIKREMIVYSEIDGIGDGLRLFLDHVPIMGSSSSSLLHAQSMDANHWM